MTTILVSTLYVTLCNWIGNLCPVFTAKGTNGIDVIAQKTNSKGDVIQNLLDASAGNQVRAPIAPMVCCDREWLVTEVPRGNSLSYTLTPFRIGDGSLKLNEGQVNQILAIAKSLLSSIAGINRMGFDNTNIVPQNVIVDSSNPNSPQITLLDWTMVDENDFPPSCFKAVWSIIVSMMSPNMASKYLPTGLPKAMDAYNALQHSASNSEWAFNAVQAMTMPIKLSQMGVASSDLECFWDTDSKVLLSYMEDCDAKVVLAEMFEYAWDDISAVDMLNLMDDATPCLGKSRKRSAPIRDDFAMSDGLESTQSNKIRRT